jgi:hypothetical protein
MNTEKIHQKHSELGIGLFIINIVAIITVYVIDSINGGVTLGNSDKLSNGLMQ